MIQGSVWSVSIKREKDTCYGGCFQSRLMLVTRWQMANTVAKSAYYKRLWVVFLSSLINIGSRWSWVFWACSSSTLFLLYYMSYCFKVLELKQERIITYKNYNKCNDTIQYISGFRVIFMCVCVQSVMIFIYSFFLPRPEKSLVLGLFS